MKKHLALAFCIVSLFLPLMASATEVGDQLPVFSGQTMDGKPIDLATVVGKKPVMLIFWSSWCVNCKQEIPKINELMKKYQQQGMEFIGINVGMNDTEKKARKYMKDYKITFPVVFDKTGALSEKYQIPQVLTVFVARKDGKVVMKFLTAPEIDDINFKGLQQLPPSEADLKMEYPTAPFIEDVKKTKTTP
jgi:peroxiredoxin